MIKAINKAGVISYFREAVWNLMTKDHNGYVEMKDAPETVVPAEIVEFQAKIGASTQVPDAVTVFPEVGPVVLTKEDRAESKRRIDEENARIEAEKAKMLAYLKDRGVRINSNIGYNKLKERYDDYKEQKNK